MQQNTEEERKCEQVHSRSTQDPTWRSVLQNSVFASGRGVKTRLKTHFCFVSSASDDPFESELLLFLSVEDRPALCKDLHPQSDSNNQNPLNVSLLCKYVDLKEHVCVLFSLFQPVCCHHITSHSSESKQSNHITNSSCFQFLPAGQKSA